MKPQLSLPIALLIALATPVPAQSQEPASWRSLGWFRYDEITGKPDSVAKFARNIGPGAYVLRTDYRTDRTTSMGAHWRSSYQTALIDCGKRTLSLLRTDYYATDSTFVSTIPGGITFTAEMLEQTDGLKAFYNYACALR